MKKHYSSIGRSVLAISLVIFLLILAACTSQPATTSLSITATTTTAPTTPTTTATSTTPTPISAIPPEVTQYAADWPLSNKDYANTRATTDSTINLSNVSTLGVAWASPIPGSAYFGAATTAPIIMGNTVYYQDTNNNVISLDKTTGKTLWQKIYNTPNIGPNGIAVGWGKIFTGADPYDMVALDMTGKELWRTNISQLSTIGIDMQPTVYNGQVLVSTVPGVGIGNYYVGGAYGTLYGLDQQTGKVTWSWLTVDSTNLWGNPAVNSGGGAWYPPAIDLKTGLQFWGIGNPAPYPGTAEFPNGSSRPGANLYTDSIVALDSATGALKWYNQVLPHDILDHDFQMCPILATATVNGAQTDIVIGAGKLGKVVAFNRKTGTQIWNVPVGKHQNDDLAAYPEGNTTVFPGTYGGVETPMAYAKGIVYVPIINLSATLTPSTLTSDSFANGTGELVALDVNTGNVLWDKQLPSMNTAGATVVNDLVFTATFDGTMYAFNAKTGAQAWTYKAPGGINSWPSVSGDTLIWPVGLGSVPSVLALKLGANTTPILNIKPADGATVNAGDITVSAQVFNFNLVEKLGQAVAAGEGHLHYFMDVEAPSTQGQPAVTAPGTYAATKDASYTWKNVTPGTHTFSVELINNDHTPLSNPVVAKSTVTVVTPTPSISIVVPADNSVIPSGDVKITVQVSNFKIVDALGQPAMTGQGHLHYFMDVDAPTTPGQPAVTTPGTYAATIATTYTWQNVTPGTHTFSVELINNDHTPLATPVVAKITVIVAPGGGQAGP